MQEVCQKVKKMDKQSNWDYMHQKITYYNQLTKAIDQKEKQMIELQQTRLLHKKLAL